MVDVASKTRLLKKRIEDLAFPEEIKAIAKGIIDNAGLNIPDAVEMLQKEWLSDTVMTKNTIHFRAAKRDPGAHFLDWVKSRAKHPFHVTYRSVENVTLRLGPEVAARIAHVIWPQEIAWAQRLRLSQNPMLATKAAMFLREAMGNPAKMFERIADLYADSYAKVEYADNEVQDLSPLEIRFSSSVPEFNPLFLVHVSRKYSELIHSMPMDRIELLAARAAKDEQSERSRISAAKIAEHSRRFPMRRMMNVISFAHSAGISPNELHKLEDQFLALLENGEIDTDQAMQTAHTPFVALLSDIEKRCELLQVASDVDFDPDTIIWNIAHLDRHWLDSLPHSYQEWDRLAAKMLAWQMDVVKECRDIPSDPISDFGFWLIEKEAPV